MSGILYGIGVGAGSADGLTLGALETIKNCGVIIFPNKSKDECRAFKLVKENLPEFSENTMFTLRVYQPWFYESLHYTLLNDGTLIVLYYDTELGREQLSDDRMEEIRSFFSPEMVYTMDVGKEADRTDGTQRYIILYDSDENEIKVGGYELEGGEDFNGYFHVLYQMLEDDYTKQWSDKLDECMQDYTTYGERYLNW